VKVNMYADVWSGFGEGDLSMLTAYTNPHDKPEGFIRLRFTVELPDNLFDDSFDVDYACNVVGVEVIKDDS